MMLNVFFQPKQLYDSKWNNCADSNIQTFYLAGFMEESQSNLMFMNLVRCKQLKKMPKVWLEYQEKGFGWN